MSRQFRIALLSVGMLAAVVPVAGPAQAQDKPAAAADDLTPEEKAEREQRKGCKVAICAAMRARKAGDDIACAVVKTWRKEHLDKMIAKAGVSWPWGKVKCTADIKLQRDMLLKSLSDAKYEANLQTQQVFCEVEREKEKPAEIKFSFAPKVTFEGGKAVKATMNWGAIEAPALVKGAMWTATATDNTFNVLQGTVVEDINAFTSERCDEVKDDWQK